MTQLVEKQELERCEAVIQKGIGAFIETGTALKTVKDRKLYKSVLNYKTFEDYCKDRWQMGRQNAHLLIDSAAAAKNVKHVIQKPPNMRQAIELAKLDNKEEQKEAWKMSSKAEKVTAKTVKESVQVVKAEKIESGTPKSKPKFNRTNDNIEWAKWTWNPVTGCSHGCEYCYARDIAMRFYGSFEPKYHPERLTAPQNTKPPEAFDNGERNVFVCSMADLFGKWVKRRGS